MIIQTHNILIIITPISYAIQTYICLGSLLFMVAVAVVAGGKNQLSAKFQKKTPNPKTTICQTASQPNCQMRMKKYI
jgi:hypothetical protein